MDKEDFDRWADERRRRRQERDERRSARRHARREERESAGREGRKEKVLHTRISDELDESLRRAANEMRVPVSNLVRNVLEDVFDVVETVTENVEDLVEDLMDEADRVRVRFRRRHRHRDRPPARIVREPREPGPPPPPPGEYEPQTDGYEAGQDQAGQDEAAGEVVDVEPERPDFPDVIGWQPLVLNAERECADCGRDLMRGDRAFLGLGEGGAPRAHLCRDCLEARR